jgi:hypothetical protein
MSKAWKTRTLGSAQQLPLLPEALQVQGHVLLAPFVAQEPELVALVELLAMPFEKLVMKMLS